MEAPANWEQILNDYASLEVENSRLRQLLDEIHRGEATPPRAPKSYDEASQITVQTCQIPGCVRVAGHQNFHCTIEAIAATLWTPDRIAPDEVADVVLFLELCKRSMGRQAEANERIRAQEEAKRSEIQGLA